MAKNWLITDTGDLINIEGLSKVLVIADSVVFFHMTGLSSGATQKYIYASVAEAEAAYQKILTQFEQLGITNDLRPAVTLVLTSLDVVTGPEDGGTVVTLTGTGFVQGSFVYFGTYAAQAVEVLNDTTIRCVTPPGTGIVDVTIQTPTTDDTLAGAFTYA